MEKSNGLTAQNQPKDVDERFEVSAKDNNRIKNAFDILLEQLGNTRSEQTGPFRMRTTSFTRHQSQADITRKIFQRNAKMKGKYDIVSPSSKCFQNLMFDNYKEKKIYRLIKSQRKHAQCQDDQQQKRYYRSRSDTWAHIVTRQRNCRVKEIRSNSTSVENTFYMEHTKVASSIRDTNLLDCQDAQSIPTDDCHEKQSSTKTSLFMVKCVLQLCRKLRGKTIK
ncbi:unnamed protein product [Mytilus coruscus]|uniref:Uncharacterized protein n=1 Tax=Mytilus coruscus TaxID=42192 RepID=A0A6J8A5T2_MYTCO|nr:unnamed protein product [Mytilus coruscus]